MANNLLLNGFYLELSAKSIAFRKLEFPDNKGLRSLRRQHQDWFIYWRDGMVYALPNVEEPKTSIGLDDIGLCNDHLQLIASRITDLLPTMFPRYEAFRK